MKKYLLLALALVLPAVMAEASIAANAPAQDEGGRQGMPKASAAPVVLGMEQLFTSVTIEPNASLPDNNPNFSCFDMPVQIDPAARAVNVKVTVSMSHTWVGDLIFQLRNPVGQHVTMLHRPGRSGSGLGDSSNLESFYPITFGNAHTDDAETMGNTLTTSEVICRDDARCQYFPNPDEDLTSLPSFAGMAGSAAAGVWQFCASDNESGDLGVLSTVRLEVSFTTPSTSACSSGSWQPAAPVHVARSRTALVYFPPNGRFYLLGGESTGSNRDLPIEEYNVAANSWTEKGDLDTGVSNTGAAVVGNYIYVPGGYTTGAVTADLMQRYDPLAGTVVLLAPMPAANMAHAVTALNGRVYVLGGSSTGLAGTTNYIYDTGTGNWSPGAPLPTAVQYPAATTDGVYVYVFGGNVGDLTTVQRYDPVANSWDTLPDMNQGRGGAAAFFDGRNTWVVGGGWNSYLASTEYRGGAAWLAGPPLGLGARTLGAAYGNGLALKAAGWNGGFVAEAETIQIDCGQPEMAVNPDALWLTLVPGQVAVMPVTISNIGQNDLVWTTTEAQPARLPPLASTAYAAASAEESKPGETLSSYDEYGLPFPAAAPPEALELTSGPVPGGLAFYADRSLFEADNPGLPVEDFEAGNVAPNSIQSCPGPFDIHTNNSCFGAGDLLPGVLFIDDAGGTASGMALLGAGWNDSPSIALVSNTLAEAFHIYFTAPDVNAAGMDLISHFNAGLVNITVYGWDGSTVLGSTVAAATNTGVFWGVTSAQPIGRITIHSPSNQAEGVDNLAFGHSGPCATPTDLPWLSLSPTNGTTLPGGSNQIQATFNAAGLTLGNTYTGTLCVNSNDPNTPRRALPVSLSIDTVEIFKDGFEALSP